VSPPLLTENIENLVFCEEADAIDLIQMEGLPAYLLCFFSACLYLISIYPNRSPSSGVMDGHLRLSLDCLFEFDLLAARLTGLLKVYSCREDDAGDFSVSKRYRHLGIYTFYNLDGQEIDTSFSCL
jgi:hypothetical protein